jgi:hypothetical protein
MEHLSINYAANLNLYTPRTANRATNILRPARALL